MTMKIVSLNYASIWAQVELIILTCLLAEIDPYDRSQLDFGRLIQSILQETQVRLVAGAQGVLKTAIEQFVPTAEDLDYPQQAQLQKDLKVISPATIETDDSLGAASGFDTEAVFRGWYPSLRKSIWLLSRIYRLVNVGKIRFALANHTADIELANNFW